MEKLGTNKIRPLTVMKLSGAYIAFILGSGFASGQECLQYYTAFGFVQSILGFIFGFLLGTYMTAETMFLGYKSKDPESRSVYRDLCGKWLGYAIDIFVTIFLFLLYMTMVSGSGATFEQQFGISPWIGCSFMAVATGVIVLLGLEKIVDTIGFIGPIIVVITIITGAIILIKDPLDVSEYEALLASGEITLLKAADNWFVSTVLYVTFGIVMGVPFISAMGTRANNMKELILGAAIGNFLFNLALAFLSFSLAAKLADLWDASIPALLMANMVHPTFGLLYSVILVLAVFTTAVPVLWSPVVRLAKPKTKRYYILTGIFVVLGYFGGQLPFEQLINFFFPLMGYVGAILIVCMVVNDIKRLKTHRKNKQLANSL